MGDPNPLPRIHSVPMVGGALCLDFTNTVADRLGERPRDYLTEPEHPLVWADRAGLVDAAEGRRSRELLATEPDLATHAFARTRALRDTLFFLFSAIAAGREDGRRLAELNDWLAATQADRRLTRGPDGIGWGWAPARGPYDAIWRETTRSAAQLAVEGTPDRIKQCRGRGCGWLFLDGSKNRSRVWCEMEVCGNRGKARRRYDRAKLEASPPKND